ncbi:MAG: hypothetical protein Q6M54_15215, partial [Thermostichus sp. DRC_bins_24]
GGGGGGGELGKNLDRLQHRLGIPRHTALKANPAAGVNKTTLARSQVCRHRNLTPEGPWR